MLKYPYRYTNNLFSEKKTTYIVCGGKRKSYYKGCKMLKYQAFDSKTYHQDLQGKWNYI